MKRAAHACGSNALSATALLCAVAVTAAAAQSADPLPSWNEGKTKEAITNFVETVTRPGSAGFVPPAERIATFDNDGTLWAEQPLYFQFLFAMDRVKALAPQHPEWKNKEPFKSLLAGDMKGVLAVGERGLVEIMMAAHANMTTDEFDKTFIVSGGGIDFMRAFAEEVYGIPPDQVIGSTGKLKVEMRDGMPVLVKLPAVDFVDDKEGKPIAIHRHVGRRPIAAFGNSDGDLQMLQWTAAGPGARLAVFIHHTDAQREWAYDRTSSIGRFDKGLDEAKSKGWTIVDMRADWKTIFPSTSAAR